MKSTMTLRFIMSIPSHLSPSIADRGMVEVKVGNSTEKDDLRASVDFSGGSIILDGDEQIRITADGHWNIYKFIKGED